MRTIAPISAVIATRDRAASLSRAFDSLLSQEIVPAEFIVVDASGDDATKNVTMKFAERLAVLATVRWLSADVPGAAPQRNQGVALATQPFVWFFDDDILFEPHCLSRMWRAIKSDSALGGVNAMIANQQYGEPGFVSRAMFTLMHGRSERSFAGKVIGPAINLLPADSEDLDEVVPIEWLNTTCTIYRRQALPSPPFDSFFTGYSMMEDVALSLRVGKTWKLANARTARIFHDSQVDAHKPDVSALAAMELVNRSYVLTRVMAKTRISDFIRLGMWELFGIVSSLTQKGGIRNLPRVLSRKFRAALSVRNLLGRQDDHIR